MIELTKKLAISLASVLLALLVAEGSLRLLAPETFWNPALPGVWNWLADDPVLGWKNRPGYANDFFRINSIGFRGAELAETRPPGSTRIACLGDSSTFGLWRSGPAELRWDSYTEILKDTLVEHGYENVEVVNAGVLGYGSSQGLRQLNLQLLDLEPDIITIRFGLNDHAPPSPRRQFFEPKSPLVTTLLYAFAHSRLLHLGIIAHRSIDVLRPEARAVALTPPDQFETDLERFAEIAVSNGIELLFVDYPSAPLRVGCPPANSKCSVSGASPSFMKCTSATTRS